MKYTTYFIKFFYRIRYWLILAPIIVALLVYWQTRHTSHSYSASCSIYTGIITGVNILSESGIVTTAYTQGSMMDNLLNIITADQTLKQVSLRLYARIMVYGDPNKDNTYVNAANYRLLYNHADPIHHLIDKSSENDSINEQRTYENLIAYETNDPSNYVYGIYQWNLPYVNRGALQQIDVKRVGTSDVIEVFYTTDDPGIVYQTLLILIDEFNKQYQDLRFGETKNVIAYFRAELKRIGNELANSEDSLTIYRVDNQVINYEDETKHVAALNRDYELQYWQSLNDYNVSDSIKKELEKRMHLNTEIIQNNNSFIFHNNNISDINEKLAMAKYYSKDVIPQKMIDSLYNELEANKKALSDALQKTGYLKYSKEGISNEGVVDEWLKQVIAYKKAEAELKVLNERKIYMGKKYIHFAPIGSTLTRKERLVDINERRYLAILDALNAALLKEKSIQMNSATLKVMNPPYYPLVASTISKHRLLTIASYFATLFFTIFFFLIIEILDRTLHHVFKAEQLTKSRVIGAFTRLLPLKARRFNQTYNMLSAQTLCNSIITYFKPNQNNIINLISNEPGEGKSFVMAQLVQQFTERGFDVTQLSWQNEYSAAPQAFIQSLKLNELVPLEKSNSKNNVILIEYPSLKDATSTEDILQDVSLNLQIIDSRRTWKNIDQQLFERTREMCNKTPLFIVLNYTKRDTAEEINGLMPPYTFFHKLFYRISQLGFTANDKPLQNV
ncbi:exopolysaccharide biosynthesis protein [Odoribacter sp. AF15-53]|uniref:exopolysaccharide biosynthesis protein n=1 Tax=Odoribacter sp. AF15-53 TaxID=2292236 RepID=UPI000E4ED007|nr:exopolysaccharide biosynthesis protein [Odoribacter sp. AF15-53]RHR82485.1 exopolysaccharide biosynthesis protein [Odoribacter sp. AF15-53]